MTKEKAEKIIKIYNWARFILVVLLLTFLFVGVATAQPKESEQDKLVTELMIRF